MLHLGDPNIRMHVASPLFEADTVFPRVLPTPQIIPASGEGHQSWGRKADLAQAAVSQKHFLLVKVAV